MTICFCYLYFFYPCLSTDVEDSPEKCREIEDTNPPEAQPEVKQSTPLRVPSVYNKQHGEQVSLPPSLDQRNFVFDQGSRECRGKSPSLTPPPRSHPYIQTAHQHHHQPHRPSKSSPLSPCTRTVPESRRGSSPAEVSAVSMTTCHVSPVSPPRRKPIDYSVSSLSRPHVAEVTPHRNLTTPPSGSVGEGAEVKENKPDLFEKENRFLREQRKCAKDPQSPPNVTVCQRAIAHPLYPVCPPNALFPSASSAFHHPMTSLYINTGPLSVAAAAAAAAGQHRSPTSLPPTAFPVTPGQLQHAMASHPELAGHPGHPAAAAALSLASAHPLTFFHRQSGTHPLFSTRLPHLDPSPRFHPYALTPVTPDASAASSLGLLSSSPSPASPPAPSGGSPLSHGGSGGSRFHEGLTPPGVVKPVPTRDVHHKLTSSPEGKVSA